MPGPKWRDDLFRIVTMFRKATRRSAAPTWSDAAACRARRSTSDSTRCIAAGLVVAADVGASTGGRPASLFALNRNRGVLLLADIGATAMRNAVCDLRGKVLTEIDHDIDIADGPDADPRPGQP